MANSAFLNLVPIPGLPGIIREGTFSFDNEFFYIFSRGQWRRSAISAIDDTSQLIPDVLIKSIPINGNIYYNNNYMFFYVGGWLSVAISPIDTRIQSKPSFSQIVPLNQLRIISSPILPTTYGYEGTVGFDENYFYIFSGGVWRKFAISTYTSLLSSPEYIWNLIENNWESFTLSWGN